MPLRLTPHSARFHLLMAALLLALPGALSVYNRYEGRVIVGLPIIDSMPVFSRSLVYLEHHNGWRAFGLVLNKPLDAEQKKSISYAPQDFDWRMGGPVAYPDSAYVLIENPEKNGNSAPSFKIMNLHEYTQTYPEIWKETLQSEEKRKNFTIYLGYSGWGTLQLDREFLRGGWGTVDLTPEMFDVKSDPQEEWRKALQKFLQQSPARQQKI